MNSYSIVITGLVQGVGFRPFIYNLATTLKLKGIVLNNISTVYIEVTGDYSQIEQFVTLIKTTYPPLSNIVDITVTTKDTLTNYKDFKIIKSSYKDTNYPIISPDFSICNDCKNDLMNENSPRYLYPFTSCTNCGPRFSIINSYPYDRCNTTMSQFQQCETCSLEYKTPSNRRFHSECNCCSNCGPNFWIYDNPIMNTEDILNKFETSIFNGDIWAIKGLGGFHLCCNPFDINSINRIRTKKSRPKKPFALMFKNIEEASKYCVISPKDKELLLSKMAPIVLLKKKSDTLLPNEIAPNNKYLGVMLPYTPLHTILFQNKITALIVTSGNISGCPLEYKNDSAIQNLYKYADNFLLHNREIFNPIDDSVVKANQIIRLARGYSPYMFYLKSSERILALGSNEKNSFAISFDDYSILSNYIGSLDNYETFLHFKNTLYKYLDLYRVEIKKIVLDLHPEFIYRELINDFSLKPIFVQHHYAHILSCLVDNNYNSNKNIIGFAFDGTGFGTDSKIWGSEGLLCNFQSFTRLFHLDYINFLPGNQCIESPYKATLCYLYEIKRLYPIIYKDLNIDYLINRLYSQNGSITLSLLEKTHSFIESSSMGRLFDSVSSLLGLCHKNTYEGEASITLENIIESNSLLPSYNFTITYDNIYTISPLDLIIQIVEDLNNHISISIISQKFHSTIVKIILELSLIFREKYTINTIALSGGVFLNNFISINTKAELERKNFIVLTHKTIPCNDQGIAAGQLAHGVFN